jgi:GDP-4-dehydro-6-deoxy-D-mannose reductase
MRILITGATGFVGQYLSRLLVSRAGNQVFGTFLSGDSKSAVAGTNLIRCDLRDESKVRHVVEDIYPDHVYHLAALSSVRDSFKDANAVYEANFFGTLNLLEAVRRLHTSARVLLVGSAHAYGAVKRSQMPITERQALSPDTPYGVSKAAADMLGGQFFQSYGIHVIRARPFNHTGPGQSPDFVCSDFAKQFAEIEKGLRAPVLTVGNIRASRDFSDVRDVVRAYELLLRKGKPGDAYNIASGRPIRLREILAVLSSLVSHKVQVRVEQARVRRGESNIVYGSNRKLRRTTSWVPEIDLMTTLRDLYLYWGEVLAAQAR